MKIAVLISGSGSNLQALLDSSVRENIQLVVSNKASAFGLERARKAGVPTHSMLKANYSSRDIYDQAVAEYLNQQAIDLVVLAGWMHILGARFLDVFQGQTINLHPALPGQYPGTHAIKRAFEDGVDRTGCMVHRVTLEVDVGEVLGVSEVEIKPTDTLAELEERMHSAEHRLLVSVVEGMVKGVQALS